MAAVSLTPSLVALTDAEPPPTPVTSPLASTVATAGWSLAQVIARRSMIWPCASRSVADSDTVIRTSNAAAPGVTVTDATGRGGVTVMEAVPLAASLVAVIVVLPGLTPVTVANASPRLPGCRPPQSRLPEHRWSRSQMDGRPGSPPRRARSPSA